MALTPLDSEPKKEQGEQGPQKAGYDQTVSKTTEGKLKHGFRSRNRD